MILPISVINWINAANMLKLVIMLNYYLQIMTFKCVWRVRFIDWKYPLREGIFNSRHQGLLRRRLQYRKPRDPGIEVEIIKDFKKSFIFENQNHRAYFSISLLEG